MARKRVHKAIFLQNIAARNISVITDTVPARNGELEAFAASFDEGSLIRNVTNNTEYDLNPPVQNLSKD